MFRKGIIAILLIVLCVTTVIGVISFFYPIRWGYTTGMVITNTYWGGSVVSGSLAVGSTFFDSHMLNLNIEDASFNIQFAGFKLRAEQSGNIQSCLLKIPLWMPFTLFATYPTIVFIRGPLRRYRRRRKGLCIYCGYNLTGNTTGIC